MNTRSITARRPLARLLGGLLAGVFGIALPGAAEVTAVSATGFTSTFRAELDAPPAAVWQAVTQLPQWWADEHTWSGKAANMVLDLHAGGCWCERWSDGRSVMHGQVLWVQPQQVLRLGAALGPLQELAVQGVLTFGIGTQGERRTLRMSYRVSGAPEAGFDKLAPLVDKVMGEQWRRLLAFVPAPASR